MVSDECHECDECDGRKNSLDRRSNEGCHEKIPNDKIPNVPRISKWPRSLSLAVTKEIEPHNDINKADLLRFV